MSAFARFWIFVFFPAVCIYVSCRQQHPNIYTTRKLDFLKKGRLPSTAGQAPRQHVVVQLRGSSRSCSAFHEVACGNDRTRLKASLFVFGTTLTSYCASEWSTSVACTKRPLHFGVRQPHPQPSLLGWRTVQSFLKCWILNLSSISFNSERCHLPTSDVFDQILPEFVACTQDHFVMHVHWRYRLNVSENSMSEITVNRRYFVVVHLFKRSRGEAFELGPCR